MNFLRSILAAILAIFGVKPKPAPPTVPMFEGQGGQIPVQPVVSRHLDTPVKSFEEMTEDDWHAWLATLDPLTRGQYPTWAEKQRRDKYIRDAALAGGPDRNLFDMNQANGFLAHPSTQSGVAYAFTYTPRPGWAIRVMPYAGSQILKVNGKYLTSTYAIIENPPVDGVILLEVGFVGERYAVQYAPR